MAVKILMADEDLAALEMARASIASLKWCDLVTVTDGNGAVECLQGQKFDGVIVTDRSLHVDGFEVIKCLRTSQINSGIPIVMLTEEDDVDTMRRGFKAGVTFFATKPSNRERYFRLFNAIHGAMETERRRHHRLPYRTPITCSLGEQSKNRFVAEIAEISEGGLSVRPSGGVELGQVLEVEFLLPQLSRPAHAENSKSRKKLFAEGEASLTGPQKVRARVRYVAPSGEIMGLDFLGLTHGQREVIQTYIAGGS